MRREKWGRGQVLGIFLSVIALGATLAEAEAPPSPPIVVSLSQTQSSMTDGAVLARDLSKLVGVSLTPLLGMSVLGLASWWSAPQEARGGLPFHQQPWFWGAGLGLILILWCGHRVPVIRKGFKIMKLWESKLSAVQAIPIVSGQLVPALLKPAGVVVTSAHAWVVPSAWAAPAATDTTSSPNVAIFAVAWILALTLGFVVWVAGHTVNVLALVSPLAIIDSMLKHAKAALVVALIVANMLSPWVGLLACAAYLFVAAWVSGWSVRLAIFGWVFSSDLILLRSRRHQVSADSLFAFSAAGLSGVPVRTWGRLVVAAHAIRFEYRVRLVQYRSVELPSSTCLVVEKGLVSPVVLSTVGPRTETLIRFPPRFRPHSAELGKVLGGLQVRDAPIIRGFAAARRWIADQFGRAFARKPSATVVS